MIGCPIPADGTYDMSWMVTPEMHAAFVRCSGDVNPLHVDDAYAQAQGYPSKLMHGALLNAFISGLVGTGLPSRRTMCLSQKVNFRHPFFCGDEVRLVATVADRQDIGAKGQWAVSLRLRFTVKERLIATGTVELVVR